MNQSRFLKKLSTCLIALSTLVLVGCGEDSKKSQACTDVVDNYCDENLLIRCAGGDYTPQQCSGNEYCGSRNGTFKCLPKDLTGCGDMHQACCEGSTCNGSLSCISNTCQTTPTVCGAQGQACCTGDVCNANLYCASNTCRQATPACGEEGQACCAEYVCKGNLYCTSNTCRQATPACGGLGQTCCTGGVCNANLDCEGNTCRQEATVACGGEEHACCTGGVCNANLTCEDNACKTKPVNPNAPFFLSSGTNITTMTKSDTLIFSVIISHPNGVNDIVGGTLTDPGGGTYGTFQSPTTPGSYTLQLSWAEINSVRAIEFPIGGGNRVFRATFFDIVGNTVEKDFTIKLACSISRYSACDGRCLDMQDDGQHCNSCGNACYFSDDCRDGKCGYYCFKHQNLSCEQYCHSIGMFCPETNYLIRGFDTPDCTGSWRSDHALRCSEIPNGDSVLCNCK